LGFFSSPDIGDYNVNGPFIVMSVPSGGQSIYYDHNEELFRSRKTLSVRYSHWGDGYNTTAKYVIFYRFVKINDNFDEGNLSGSCSTSTPIALAYLDMQEGYIVSGSTPRPVGSTRSNKVQIIVNTPVLHFAQRTCTTPYVDEGIVWLPILYPHQLPSVGSTGPEKQFTLEVNCPVSFGYIGYWVEPVHGVADGLESQGVININPASAAKGVGLQITSPIKPWPYYNRYDLYRDANRQVEYRPIKFGTTNRYPWGYYPIGNSSNPLTDQGTYPSVPLRIKVYRTGDIVPGPFNAAVRIHMVYR